MGKATTAKGQGAKKAGASGSGSGAAKKRSGDWDSSTVNDRDLKGLRKMGLIPTEKDKVRKPGSEVCPKPGPGWTVIFLTFLMRGLSLPAHEFLRGFLFVHRVQLYQLTPNTIFHIAFFITLCECFLGVAPHWGLWKRLYYVKRFPKVANPATVGGFGVCILSDVVYFNLKMKESVTGWRRKWFYIRDDKLDDQVFGIAPLSDAPIVKKKTWTYALSDVEEQEAGPLLESIAKLVRQTGKELAGTAVYSLFIRRRVQPIQHRSHPMWEYSGVNDSTRCSKEELSLKVTDTARKLSKLSKEEAFVVEPTVTPFSKKNPLPKNHPKFVSLPPRPESGEPEPEDDLTPDEEDPGVTHIDSEGDEGDEVEGDEVEEEVREAKKRSRDVADLKDGMISSSGAILEEPQMVQPLSYMAPPSESGERAQKKKIIYASISSSDSESSEEAPMGNPFKLRACEHDDLVDTAGDASPSVSSKNEETSIPPGPPESSNKPHPFVRMLEDVKQSFFQVDNERKLFLDEKNKVVQRASTLEKLKALEEENAALKLAADVEKSQKDRLLDVVHTLTGGDSLTSRSSAPGEQQTDAVTAAEERGKGLRHTLSKTQGALAHLHEVMLPGADVPKSLESLADVFHANDEAIKGFSYLQTERGARSFISVAMAHGVQAVPVGGAGSSVAGPSSAAPPLIEPAEDYAPAPEGNVADVPEGDDVPSLLARISLLEENIVELQRNVAAEEVVAQRAITSDGFMLSELQKASEQLLFARLDEAEENKRVGDRVEALRKLAELSDEVTLWSDPAKREAVTLLQDRIRQVEDLVERCRGALALLHDAMFPLNPLPVGLSALLERFHYGKDVSGFVRAQIVAGAELALTFVRSHYPKVDFAAVVNGPPVGKRKVTMMQVHYDVV